MQPTPPEQRGERTQAESSHWANGSRHAAGSSGGMLVDGVFISDLGRAATDKTDKKGSSDCFVGFVSSYSEHS